MRIAIVGGGVIGITSAVAVKEAFPNYEITVFSEFFTPNTTGDGSAGLWGPYILGNNDPKKIIKWSSLTHKWMENFWKNGMCAEVGLCLQPCYQLATDAEKFEIPYWLSVTLGGRELTKKELQNINEKTQSEYTRGTHFLTFSCQPVKFLPYFMNKLKSMNVNFVQRKINDLKILQDEGFDIVIHCTGVGARELKNDELVKPVRGQVMRVKCPWLFEGISENDHPGNYIIPNYDSVVLGGTKQEDDYDCTVRKSDSILIRKGCERLNPSLKKCEVLKEWVGLRPGRISICLEPEIINSPNKKDFLIIHNYGHGGSGVTLSWGCALEVVEILHQQLKIKNISKL